MEKTLTELGSAIEYFLGIRRVADHMWTKHAHDGLLFSDGCNPLQVMWDAYQPVHSFPFGQYRGALKQVLPIDPMIWAKELDDHLRIVATTSPDFSGRQERVQAISDAVTYVRMAETQVVTGTSSEQEQQTDPEQTVDDQLLIDLKHDIPGQSGTILVFLMRNPHAVSWDELPREAWQNKMDSSEQDDNTILIALKRASGKLLAWNAAWSLEIHEANRTVKLICPETKKGT